MSAIDLSHHILAHTNGRLGFVFSQKTIESVRFMEMSAEIFTQPDLEADLVVEDMDAALSAPEMTGAIQTPLQESEIETPTLEAEGNVCDGE